MPDLFILLPSVLIGATIVFVTVASFWSDDDSDDDDHFDDWSCYP